MFTNEIMTKMGQTKIVSFYDIKYDVTIILINTTYTTICSEQYKNELTKAAAAFLLCKSISAIKLLKCNLKMFYDEIYDEFAENRLTST